MLTATEPPRQQRRAIQPQSSNGKCSSRSKRMQAAIVQFEEVPAGWLLAWMPKLGWVLSRRPIIVFVLVATKTAVDQILKIVGPAFCFGLKMIHRELSASIRFGYAAEFAGIPGALANLLPSSRGH